MRLNLKNREIMKVIWLLGFVVVVSIAPFQVSIGQNPVSNPEKIWNFKSDYSDEFNTGVLDQNKWDNDIKDWGTWSWKPENAYIKDTVLALQMKHDPHSRGGKDYYFTSGIVQIPKKITYGYFEAKIKACQNWPGEAPAFWLYSQGVPIPTGEGDVQYSEIDAVEIFQIVNELKTIEMNLHARIIKDGVLTWIRPGQGYAEITRNSWEAPWDPRDDYHTYGVVNRLDSIIWYVDGVERGRKANLYWHLPMNVTVSMGLRNPYEKYINGVRTVTETLESPDGFPTEMYCDYVRVWQAPPQIVVDKEYYENTLFGQGRSLMFEYEYDAGSGFSVSEGLTVKLVEKDAAGSAVNEISTIDEVIAGRAAGKSLIHLELPYDLTLTEDLPTGHYYELEATFQSTKEGATEVNMEAISGIQIASNILNVTNSLNNNIAIYPNPANNSISIDGMQTRGTELQIFNMIGVEQSNVIIISGSSNKTVIDISSLPSGIYLLKTSSEELSEALRFVKN